MPCKKQVAMLKKIQEMEFVALELNLYLDTHPCDADAINDYNCATQTLEKYMQEYQEEYGPLLNFGMGGASARDEWQWIASPWPWEL